METGEACPQPNLTGWSACGLTRSRSSSTVNLSWHVRWVSWTDGVDSERRVWPVGTTWSTHGNRGGRSLWYRSMKVGREKKSPAVRRFHGPSVVVSDGVTYSRRVKYSPAATLNCALSCRLNVDLLWLSVCLVSRNRIVLLSYSDTGLFRLSERRCQHMHLIAFAI